MLLSRSQSLSEPDKKNGQNLRHIPITYFQWIRRDVAKTFRLKSWREWIEQCNDKVYDKLYEIGIEPISTEKKYLMKEKDKKKQYPKKNSYGRRDLQPYTKQQPQILTKKAPTSSSHTWFQYFENASHRRKIFTRATLNFLKRTRNKEKHPNNIG